MLDLWDRFWWVAILAALIAFWTISALRSRSSAARLEAVAALCDQHGMGRVEDASTQFVGEMLPAYHPEVRYAFANGDWSLWLSALADPKGGGVFSVLMFSAEGLNMPYVAVGRKGAVELPLAGRGQEVQLESIDFTDRFRINADDRRAAVMLVDQGMMQWLLDLDQISFRISGPLVTAVVKEPRTSKPSVAGTELLFRFQEGFAGHVSQLTYTEFAAPKELAAAAIQAMRMVPNLLSNLTSGRDLSAH